MRVAFLIGLAVAVLSVGCAAVPETAGPGSGTTADALRKPQICPAIAILCVEGYRPKSLPNCRQTCVPDHGWECTSDDDCAIYCITTPCPQGECVGHSCQAQDLSPCATVLCIEGTHCEAHGGRASCVPNGNDCGEGLSWNEATGQCECMTLGLCITGWIWDPVSCDCLDPCSAVRCAAGTHCEVVDGGATCAPDSSATSCVVSGCSGQICQSASDEPIFTTCEWREEYACYASASCEVQADGRCGWTQTPELVACLSGSGV